MSLSTGSGVTWVLRIMRMRFRWTAVLLVVLLGGLAGSPVAAQDVQVPLDRDSTRFVVDAELRRDVGLFPEVSGFQEARLYRSGDAEYVFVIRYEQEGRVLRERRSLSPAEVTDLRARVTKALAGTDRLLSRAQEGRYGLVAATTFHGLVEGALLAGAFDLGASESATLALSGGALGFFAPLLATRNMPVSEAEADMVGYGGLQGYAHAGQVMGVLAGEELPGRATAGVVALGGVLEGAIGYRVARRNNWSTGHAEMVTVNGAGGNLVGFGIGASLVGETDEPGEGTPRLVAGASLLGSLGGMYLGHRLGQTDRYTEGDARVYALSALQGSYLMGSVLSLQDDGSPRAGALLLTGAGVSGAALGHRLIRNRDFTATQGSLVGLGAVAGGLLGAAVTVSAESGTATTVAQAFGSAAGFGITYAVLEGEARRQSDRRSSAVNLNLNVGPAVARTSGRVGTARDVVPRVTLTASF